ncbi:MAG: IclR family transcriptional regulator [Burkholderiaceae bacterium]
MANAEAVETAATPASKGRGEHQNIARAALVLDVLAKSGSDGLRLAAIVKQTQLSKTAVHRCLAGLVAHGLATLDEQASHYFLGDRILNWAHGASGRFELAKRAVPYLERLAEATGDTAYLLVRSGAQMVCFGRVLGSYPVKMLSLDVGGSRAMSMGAGGLALLAALPPEEAERIMIQNASDPAEGSVPLSQTRRLAAAARQQGFAQSNSALLPGMAGIAVAVREPDGAPVAALSISAVAQRLAAPREQLVVKLLRTEASRMEGELGTLLQRYRQA